MSLNRICVGFLVLMIYIFSHGNHLPQGQTFSSENFVGEIKNCVVKNKDNAKIIYNETLETTKENVLEEISVILKENNITREFLKDIDVSFSEKENASQVDLTLKYKEDAALPLYSYKSNEQTALNISKQFNVSKGDKISLIIKGNQCTDDGVFSILDTAELNSAFLPYEADEVCFEKFPEQDGYVLIKMWLNFSADKEQIEIKQKELYTYCEKYANEINEMGLKNPKDKYYAIFNLICNNVSYDERVSATTRLGQFSSEISTARTAYGALVNGRTICNGYARGFKAICDKMDLPCWVVCGEKDGVKHAWNIVYLDDKQFFVDCTAFSQGEEEKNCFFISKEKLDSLGYVLNDYFIIPKRLWFEYML